MKRTIRLNESDFQRIVKEVVKRTLKENESIPFEELYDKIQDVTNETMNFCAPMAAQSERDERTQQLMDELSDIANRFSNVAHELEEHLAWD